jgi:CDP-glycerol glycerophosphotransferase
VFVSVGLLRRLLRPVVPIEIRRTPRPATGQLLVAEVGWRDDKLVLSGRLTGSRKRLILRHGTNGHEHVFPLEVSDDAFTLPLPVTALPSFGATLPLRSGDWSLRGCRWTGQELPEARAVGLHEFTLRKDGENRLTLRVRKNLSQVERGLAAQAALQWGFYEQQRSQAVRDMIVFDSMFGKQYSCNPRAIFEQLRCHEPNLEFFWTSADAQFPPPEGARTVLKNSREHYEALARARVIVANGRMVPWYRKSDGQTYLQTWHGTPLKTLGFDLTTLTEYRGRGWEEISVEVAQWDILISPNPYTTRIMRGAYRYEGEIWETGYPRNDLLKAPDAEERGTAVRARLGIAPDKRVVLYAPTWRDDLIIGDGPRRVYELALNVKRARATLGRDHVLLVRPHHFMATNRAWRGGDGFVVDVSDYPDIADLYLAADVLVTDYSSAMFDFAVTGKPMLFFAYDLERYRDEVRGFYFDLEAQAPGPVLRTSDEILDAIRAGAHHEYADAYAAFVKTYCPYDDGFASVRAIERILRTAPELGLGTPRSA